MIQSESLAQAASQDSSRNTIAMNAVDNDKWIVPSYPNVSNAFMPAHRLPGSLSSQHRLIVIFLCAIWAEHDDALLLVARICISEWITER